MGLIQKKSVLILSAEVFALITIMIPLPSAAAPLVADHTKVEKHNDIPQYWINEVKKMWLNVPGESHSYGYRIGLELLQGIDSRFQANRTEDGAPPEALTDQHLRISGHRWSGSGWSYGAGEANWYTNATGIANINAHLTYSNTHNLAIAAMGFGWCWDMIWHNPPGGGLDPVYQVHWAGSSEGGPQGDLRWGLDAGDQSLTGNSVSMDTYLNATQQYIDYSKANNYPTKVFFTTGPVDDSSGESGYQLHLKQEHIRNYVKANDGILFDYADILTWGDDGTEAINSWTDYGGTLRVFPKIHPDNEKDFNAGITGSSGHIGQRGALRLGKAMWWMLARIAGWDGVSGGGDTISPTVSSTAPVNGATNINPATAVTATFSEAVTASTVNATTFTLNAGAFSVPGIVTLTGTTATFQPSALLANSTTYTATITTGVKDLAGNAMTANYVWSFATSPAADTTPPTVTGTTPAANATSVSVNTTVTATFSETLSPSTFSTASFTLKDGNGVPVAGAVNLVGALATFTPSSPLSGGTMYIAMITTTVKDSAGNSIAAPYSWSFATASLSSVDSDGDGVPDATDVYPNDPTRATFPTTSGTGTVTVDASGNGPAVLQNVRAVADTDPSLNTTGKPSDFVFPDGLVSYEVRGIAPGSSVTVRITFPTSLTAGSRIYKVCSSGYHEFPGAVISGNVVTLPLTDGGVGDSDGAANGIISDPVGVAEPLPAPGTGSSSSGGGCSAAPGGGDQGDFSGAYGALGYATLVFALWVRRKSKRA